MTPHPVSAALPAFEDCSGIVRDLQPACSGFLPKLSKQKLPWRTAAFTGMTSIWSRSAASAVDVSLSLATQQSPKAPSMECHLSQQIKREG